ncbi:hypothetical protein C8R45DRAFT_114572 [Mycena sanguinolenta]|nr:hypothetical protein C8R45DRAFT_114572 [Mycena sanguinolenta]
MSSLMNEKMSVLSDRTLCASPEPLPPPRISLRPSPVHAARTSVRIITAVAFTLWSANLSLSLVEYFRLGREPVPLQMRVVLAWAVCSALLVLTAAAVFLSTLVRRPSAKFVRFLCGFSILMSVTSCIVGFAVLFPVVAEWCVPLLGLLLILMPGGMDSPSATGCLGWDHAVRLFLCGGVPVASVWTWVWIPAIRVFSSALEEQ